MSVLRLGHWWWFRIGECSVARTLVVVEDMSVRYR